MARQQLRDNTIYIQDGFGGTGKLSANATQNDTTINVNTLNTTASVNTIVAVGARFVLNGETTNTIHTVTTANTLANVTDTINFSPKLGAGTYNSANASQNTLTFLPCKLEVTIGEGNVTWSEKKEYEYLMDRGNLDTVREGNEVPVEVSLEFSYEVVTTGTSEDISPVDAIKQTGCAANWVSSAADQCEPYAVDLIIFHDAPCGATQDETLTFTDFRWESLDYDIDGASIAVSGKCNVTTVNAVRA